MARKPLRVGLGHSRVNSVNMWASEPGYINAMNKVIKGLEQELLDIMEMWETEAPDVMMEALQPVFERSQFYVPKKTGELMRSGYLEVTSRKGEPRVEIGYARGGKPRYAVMVHEMPTYHAAPTSYKFLERAIMEDLNGIYQRLGAAYAARLGM